MERWWPASSVPVDAAVGKSNHLIVGRYENPAGYYRLDRRAGTVTQSSVPLNAGEAVLKWGFVPGTDELHFLAGSRGVGQITGYQKFVFLREPLPNPYVPKAAGKHWEWQAATDSEPDSVHFAWRDGGADAVFGFNVTRLFNGTSAGVLQTMNFPPPSPSRNLPTLVTSTVEVAEKIRSLTAPTAGKQVLLAMQSDQPGGSRRSR